MDDICHFMNICIKYVKPFLEIVFFYDRILLAVSMLRLLNSIRQPGLAWCFSFASNTESGDRISREPPAFPGFRCGKERSYIPRTNGLSSEIRRRHK